MLDNKNIRLAIGQTSAATPSGTCLPAVYNPSYSRPAEPQTVTETTNFARNIIISFESALDRKNSVGFNDKFGAAITRQAILANTQGRVAMQKGARMSKCKIVDGVRQRLQGFAVAL